MAGLPARWRCCATARRHRPRTAAGPCGSGTGGRWTHRLDGLWFDRISAAPDGAVWVVANRAASGSSLSGGRPVRSVSARTSPAYDGAATLPAPARRPAGRAGEVIGALLADDPGGGRPRVRRARPRHRRRGPRRPRRHDVREDAPPRRARRRPAPADAPRAARLPGALLQRDPPADASRRRRGLRDHGAGRVPGDVRVEHDLHGHRPARDRDAPDDRAGHRADARGARGPCEASAPTAATARSPASRSATSPPSPPTSTRRSRSPPSGP